MRTTLAQVRQSRLPEAIGRTDTDIPGICKYVNQAQQQLINAGGETGFWGGWVRAHFAVDRTNPYVTLPREFARIINMDYCRTPVRIQNEFFDMLPDGVGLQDFNAITRPGCTDWCGLVGGYERGVWPTMKDVAATNQFLRVYLADSRDAGLRMLVGPCLDQNGNAIYTQDGVNPVNGFYLALQSPFATSAFVVTQIGGIQKDVTFGDVLLFQVDATTGAEVLLSRYGPNETNPAYRRYYLNSLPCSCPPVLPGSPCLNPAAPQTTVAVTALAKLEYVPVVRDTDWLIIGNIPALIEECKSIRYADMDTAEAAGMENKCHLKAIRLLNQELGHYLGKLNPAINVAPFGTATLERQGIGRMM